MVEDRFKSEREFLKLLISLDTAAIGALLYGQERLLPQHTPRAVASLFGSALLCFVISLGLGFFASRIIIGLEHVGYTRSTIPDVRLFKSARLYDYAFFWAFALFYSGVLSAVAFMIWNLKHFLKISS